MSDDERRYYRASLSSALYLDELVSLIEQDIDDEWDMKEVLDRILLEESCE